jgi:hypothetical protein
MSHIKDRLSNYHDFMKKLADDYQMVLASDVLEMLDQLQDDLEQDEKENGWIPVSERLPEECVPVNIVWINRNPETYYSKIKDVPFSATGVYYNRNWYWYSSTCVDYLAEYGKCEWDLIDKAIDITHWQPLPEPYKED